MNCVQEDVQPKRRGVRQNHIMAKPNHARRSRPRPRPVRRRRAAELRAADQRARRELDRWRRG
jgi:hypothetical protein